MSLLSRREALALLAGATASVPLAALTSFTSDAVDNNVNPRVVWEPVENNPVVRSVGKTQASARMFPTLLPMGALIPDAIDAWYLWAWHHDTYPQLHLWTAPRAEGPYTDRSVYVGPPSPGFPVNYDQTHFSSGDIVWDAANSRLVSTPHSLRIGRRSGNGESCQDSFLMESADGLTWSFLDGNNAPRLLCGEPRTIDSVHTGYGRLLRDLDGHLTTYNGRYWWIYRAQRHDAGENQPTYYVPALASAPSLSAYPWTKHGKAFDMVQAGTGLFGIGSFVRAAKKHSVYYAEGTAVLAPSSQYLNTTDGLNMDWVGPGTPVPIPNASDTVVAGAGANLIRDPWTGLQYLVQDSFDLDQGGNEIRVYRSVVE